MSQYTNAPEPCLAGLNHSYKPLVSWWPLVTPGKIEVDYRERMPHLWIYLVVTPPPLLTPSPQTHGTLLGKGPGLRFTVQEASGPTKGVLCGSPFWKCAYLVGPEVMSKILALKFNLPF